MSIPQLYGDVCGIIDIASDTTASSGVHVVASATANVKGLWTQMIASTPRDIEMLMVGWKNNQNCSSSLDIGIGGSGSEIALIKDWCIGLGGGAGHLTRMPMQVRIPAGSRISCRIQSSVASNDTEVSLQGFAGNAEGYAGIDALTFSAGATTGAAVTLPGARFTFTGYVQILAATTRDYQGVMVSTDLNANGANQSWLFCLAVGGSGLEQDIITNAWMNGDNYCFVYPFLPIFIPSGTRLSIKHMTEQNPPTGAPNYNIYGVYK